MNNETTTLLVDRSLSFFGNTAPTDPDTPLNEIVIRKWELNENSTHYDKLIAAPNDEDLIKFWAGWAGIMLTTAVLCTAIWVPLMFSKVIKKNPFNYYLIFLLTPDMLVAWICGFTCLSNALAGHFTSAFMCQFQSFYMIASICANSWLNALVAYQLYKMLSSAHRFLRYTPPTNQQVMLQAAGIYAYSCFLGLWGTLGFSWWPHKTRLTIGAACIPMDFSYGSTAFFYGVFFPLLFGLPLAGVCYAGYKIWKHGMLPPRGRRRLLAIYFFRLAAVFLIMWLPGLLLLFVTGAWLDPWVEWAGGSWSHLQGAVSALVSLMKPDIWKAVVDFWCCRNPEESGDGRDSTRSSFFITRWSVRGSLLFGGKSASNGRPSFFASFTNPMASFGSRGSDIGSRNSSGMVRVPEPLVSIPADLSELSAIDEDLMEDMSSMRNMNPTDNNNNNNNNNDTKREGSSALTLMDPVEEETDSSHDSSPPTTSIMSSLFSSRSSGAVPMEEDESEKLMDDAEPIHWDEPSGTLSTSNQPVDWNNLSGALSTGEQQPVNWNESEIDPEVGEERSEHPVDWNDSDPDIGQQYVNWNDSDGDLGHDDEEPVNWNDSDADIGYDEEEAVDNNQNTDFNRDKRPSNSSSSDDAEDNKSYAMSFQDELDSRASLLSRTSITQNQNSNLMSGSYKDEPKTKKDDVLGSNSARF